MASGTIKRQLQVKSFSTTQTTSSAGTFIIPTSELPSDFNCIVGIKSSSIGGSNYTVQYSDRTYGIYNYAAPHNPVVNTSVTMEFFYI